MFAYQMLYKYHQRKSARQKEDYLVQEKTKFRREDTGRFLDCDTIHSISDIRRYPVLDSIVVLK